MLELSSGTRERNSAVQGDVVDSPVPGSSVHHSVSAKSHDSPDASASETIVPVVILIDRKRSSNECGTEDRSISSDQLPHRRVVVGSNLELRV